MILTMPMPKYLFNDITRNSQSQSVSVDNISDKYLNEIAKCLDKEDIKSIAEDLLKLKQECSVKGWDGYNAKPVSSHAFRETRFFISLLPHYIDILPELTPTPLGNIALEWRKDKDNILMLTISGKRKIVFASIFNGKNKHYGTESFIDEIPKIIKELISNF